jgi:hypothetical protein
MKHIFEILLLAALMLGLSLWSAARQGSADN